MTLRLSLVLGALALGAGCTVTSAPPPATPVVVAEAPSAGAAPVAPSSDPHFLAPDDYLVRFPENNDTAHVAKQLAAPVEPGGVGVFLSGRTSHEIRSAEFWLTRPATPSDVVVGATLFCFEGNWSGTDQIRHPPRTPDEARGGQFRVAQVTDASELAQGLVRVGRYRCSLDAVRAPLAP